MAWDKKRRFGIMVPVAQETVRNSPQQTTVVFEQSWREYVPVGLDGFDLKTYLRNRVETRASADMGGVPLSFLSRNDYGDDVYNVSVGKEPVLVVARSHMQKVGGNMFPEKDRGIFYMVSDANAREVEGSLARAFAVL